MLTCPPQEIRGLAKFPVLSRASTRRDHPACRSRRAPNAHVDRNARAPRSRPQSVVFNDTTPPILRASGISSRVLGASVAAARSQAASSGSMVVVSSIVGRSEILWRVVFMVVGAEELGMPVRGS